LRRGALDEAGRQLSTTSAFFSGDGELQGNARATASIVATILSARNSGDGEALGQSLRLLRVDALGKDAFIAVASTVTSELIVRSLSAGDIPSALRVLALVDFSIRTPQHHEWLARALSALSFEQREVLLGADIQRMVWAYASKDEVIKERYLALLTDFIRRSVNAKESSRAVALLEVLIQARPDPSVKNDELRLLVTDGLLEEGHPVEAQKMLSEVKTSIPFSYSLKNQFRRYGSFAALLGVAFLIGIVARILKSRRSMRPDGAGTIGASVDEDEAAVGDDPQREFVSYARDPVLGEDFSEYRECLARFGLQEGVKLAEIKAAYRSSVKSCHPDLNPNASREDAQRFIELTKSYDRLVALHNERFKGK
jgi:hypothetical protein